MLGVPLCGHAWVKAGWEQLPGSMVEAGACPEGLAIQHCRLPAHWPWAGRSKQAPYSLPLTHRGAVGPLMPNPEP